MATATLSEAAWDAFLNRHAEAHVLQSSMWGRLKAGFGWSVERVQVGDAGAQVLFRRLPLGLSIGYLPKGPVGKDWGGLWQALDEICQRRRAVFLKVEPDAWEGEFDPAGAQNNGFQIAQPIQPRRTIVIDLHGSEEDWLARMKQKTRYNIRLAAKKDVTVRPSNDLAGFSRLMQTTGARDGFGVHSEAYYREAYQLFYPSGACELLTAEFEGQSLAMLMVFMQGSRAWYFYGASSDCERNRMPAYLLQWEAMRLAAARGCVEYDLWGVPDADADALEEGFSQREDGLWGVYRFKRGFGGELKRSAGAWEKVYNPALYRLYQLYTRRAGGENA